MCGWRSCAVWRRRGGWRRGNRGQGRLDASCSARTRSLFPSRQRWKQHCSCRKECGSTPRPKRPPRARCFEAPNTDAREVERLAHRVEQYSQRMAELLRRGLLEPSTVYAFLMTKGGQQVPQANPGPKLGQENWAMAYEGAERKCRSTGISSRRCGRADSCSSECVDCEKRRQSRMLFRPWRMAACSLC